MKGGVTGRLRLLNTFVYWRLSFAAETVEKVFSALTADSNRVSCSPKHAAVGSPRE